MFSRSSSAPNSKLMERLNGHALPATSGTSPTAPAMPTQAQSASLLGQDIKITGIDLKISSVGTLRIDGDVQGEVYGAAVVIGDSGTVTGSVFAEEVIVRGHVFGIIRARKVVLQSSSHVEGDIHNNAIVVEPGARFDGRCRHLEERFELSIPN